VLESGLRNSLEAAILDSSASWAGGSGVQISKLAVRSGFAMRKRSAANFEI
jgi:hypothetical protein